MPSDHKSLENPSDKTDKRALVSSGGRSNHVSNVAILKEKHANLPSEILKTPENSLEKNKKIARISEHRSNSDQIFDNLDDELLKLEAVARFLGLKPKTIKNWIAKRVFPFIRVGRAVLIRKATFLLWLEKQEFKP